MKLKVINEKIKKASSIIKDLWHKPLLFSVLAALITVIIVESLSRHSVIEGFLFLFRHPIGFFINILIITATYSLTYLLPKKLFCQFFASFVYIALGITNCILLTTRITPFEAVDLSILRTGISIVNVYMSVFQIILISVAILVCITGIVTLFIRLPKVKINMKKALISSAVSVTVAVIFIGAFTYFRIIPKYMTEVNDAYDEYGFTYCFGRSIFDRGIPKPDDYSEYTVDEILKSIGNDKTNKPSSKPNIIMIQLESFMDLSYFNGLEFEKDPTPNFTKLKKTCYTGLLHVPSIGSGTANTEFEVLTGMSLDYFGTGEYPYKTVLQSHTCETICYDLKELGYGTHAIHNHTGTFYDRNIAYSNLGFDTFTPIEYMWNYETNCLGWAKDFVLTNEIIKALDSTEKEDFVFAVSVQGHGMYPSEPVENEQLIMASGDYDEETLHQYSYYAYQLSETDAFIGELINKLSEREEKCVLVLYGDHQPSMEYSLDEISLSDKHDTDYIIWTNYSNKHTVKDMESYQLSSYVLDTIGINNGVLTKLHQNYQNNDDYYEALEMLEYDMLYGDLIVYGNTEPYQPTELKLGIDEIKISKVSTGDDIYYIIGENFTDSSEIYINGNSSDTSFISNTVLVLDEDLSEGDIITVHQITNDFVDLGASKEFVYIPEEDNKIIADGEED